MASCFFRDYFPKSKIALLKPMFWHYEDAFKRFIGKDNVQEIEFPALHNQPYKYEDFLAKINDLKECDVLSLPACTHMASGRALYSDIWENIMSIVKKNKLITLFDLTQQGLASGSLSQDAGMLRKFAGEGIPMLVVQSFSHNAALYGERIGALHVLCSDEGERERVWTQMQVLIRRNSICPIHGARIITRLSENPTYFANWEQEIRDMAKRLNTIRSEFYECLSEEQKKQYSFIPEQRGIFASIGNIGTKYLIHSE